jgi:hypothetical protein
MHVYVRVYMYHINRDIFVGVCIHVYVQDAYMYVCVYIYTCIHTYAYIHTRQTALENARGFQVWEIAVQDEHACAHSQGLPHMINMCMHVCIIYIYTHTTTTEPSKMHVDFGSVKLQFKTSTPVPLRTASAIPEEWVEHWSKTKNRPYYKNK